MTSKFPNSWSARPLADCMSAIIDYRGKSPRKTSTGIPLVTAKIVKAGRILTPDEFIAPEDYDQWMRRGTPQTGDVLLTTEAPLGEVAQIDRRRIALAQRLITLRGKPNVLNNTFLKFALQSDFVQAQLRARSTGTTVHGIRQSELRKIELPVPPIEEQDEIAHVLGALDDKIELNRRTNETLEAIARAIFKSWFVDFDPVHAKSAARQPFGMDSATAALFPSTFKDSPLGEIPKGWHIGKMSELASLSRDPLTPEHFANESFDHYSIPAFDESRWPKAESGCEIKSNKFTVPPNAVLLSKLNPRIRRVWLPFPSSGRRSIASTEFLVATPEPPCSREFLYALFSSDSFSEVFENLVTGTSGSHQRVKPEFLLSMNVLVASRECNDAFTRTAKPLFERVARNIEESHTLAALLDLLLPKLISGEIRVADAEKMVEERV